MRKPAVDGRCMSAATILAFLVLAAAISLPAAQQNKEQVMSRIDDLLSESSETRDQAVDAFLQERKSVIERLIPLIEPANAERYSDETRCAAAYLLGELHAIEAIPALSRALADPPGPVYFTDISRYDTPVFNALVKIGRPAVPAMISNIETSDDPTLRRNSLDVLYHVLGGKRRLIELLDKLDQRALSKDTPEPAVSRRVRDARARVEDHYKEDEEPLY